MLDAKDLRYIQIKVGNDWVNAQLAQIEAGDVFRMFEPDGTPVVGDDGCVKGHTAFIASEAPGVIIGKLDEDVLLALMASAKTVHNELTEFPSLVAIQASA